MEKSESIKNIAEAQLAIQKEIKDIAKDSAGYGYNYTSFDKLVQYLRPLLAKHSISFMQMPIGGNKDGFAIGLRTLYMHSPSGEWISTTLCSPIAEHKGMNIFRLRNSISRLRRTILNIVKETAELPTILKHINNLGDYSSIISKRELISMFNSLVKLCNKIKSKFTEMILLDCESFETSSNEYVFIDEDIISEKRAEHFNKQRAKWDKGIKSYFADGDIRYLQEQKGKFGLGVFGRNEEEYMANREEFERKAQDTSAQVEELEQEHEEKIDQEEQEEAGYQGEINGEFDGGELDGGELDGGEEGENLEESSDIFAGLFD